MIAQLREIGMLLTTVTQYIREGEANHNTNFTRPSTKRNIQQRSLHYLKQNTANFFSRF
jgi:hypothetical protein